MGVQSQDQDSVWLTLPGTTVILLSCDLGNPACARTLQPSYTPILYVLSLPINKHSLGDLVNPRGLKLTQG